MNKKPPAGKRNLNAAREIAIDRAKTAFLCATTAYGRRRAMRRLIDLGVTEPTVKQ